MQNVTKDKQGRLSAVIHALVSFLGGLKGVCSSQCDSHRLPFSAGQRKNTCSIKLLLSAAVLMPHSQRIRNASKWDLLLSMGVFTLLASNIKGFAFKFACVSRPASCVNEAWVWWVVRCTWEVHQGRVQCSVGMDGGQNVEGRLRPTYHVTWK